MIARLLYLNWNLFLSRLMRVKTVLMAGYSLFLLIMLAAIPVRFSAW